MFADPQSITVNAVAQSLPATKRDGMSSTYEKDDDAYHLVISHQEGKRLRSTVRVNARKVAADPLATGVNQEYTASVYIVLDRPKVGYTNAEIKDIALALSGWATSATLLRVLGGES